jgi:3-methyladenine DNA glycosylase AlkD
MHASTASLQRLLQTNADPKLAGPMARYMRNQFPYLGIRTPERRILFRQFASSDLPSVCDTDRVVRELWLLPEREYQYAAIELVEKQVLKLPEDFVQTLQHLITSKSWWDTVDSLSKSVGLHFKRYPEAKANWLPRWRQSDNIWLRRSALLFQLHYKEQTDFPLLCEIIRENLGSKEFFINKAIGWALRQHARHNSAAVKQFADTHKLHPLSRREALKHVSEKAESDLRSS